MEKHELIREEHDMLKFWEDNDCFAQLRAQAAGKPLFRFLDGPITANNPMGVHHARGRSLKDIYVRYKFLRGHDCRAQNGFDAQGLWVEVGVEKELGFESKRDIEAYGLDKFTNKCKERVETYAGVITEQSKRLGMWMDWGNDYFTHTDENIEGIWHFLRKCHDSGWLRQEYKPMPWCPRCGTSLSEHEMTGSYQVMTHDSVFFQLPVHGRDFNMLVWTTTPWTLSSNVALAVNPEIDYALVKLHAQDKPIVLAKQAIKLLGDDKADVLDMFKGSTLVGLTYETCFEELPKLQFEHRIVSWEDVSAEEGTGIVHIAPGCGAEDFQLGLRENLPQVMPVDDLGIFLEGFGFYTGKNSDTVAPEVFAELEKRGKLYKVLPYEHNYPICWRCKTPVIFRLVPAWYIATAELKPRLLAAVKKVKWEPESAGRRMEDWITNMGDWNISRKRYYGLPLPFYPCDCGHLTVIGSKVELGTDVELHRPWIDDVTVTCAECGKQVQRISDTGDVWLDAGIVPYSTLGYFNDRAAWEKNFPAEWVSEMNEQVRLWFYSMLFMSVVLEDRPPYERVMCYAMVAKEDGSKFSKTGTMIKFDDAAEEIGSDSLRYLFAGTPNANDVRFGFAMGDEARRKLLGFRNIYTFFDTYYQIDKPNLIGSPACGGAGARSVTEGATLNALDNWLLLRTNQFITSATALMDDYKAYVLVKEFEDFVDDVSNWYVRLNRRRFWKAGDEADKRNAYGCLYFALKTMCQVMAPIIPFGTEAIWQKLVRAVEPDAALSIHMSTWPQPIADLEDNDLLEQTKLAREVIATALRLRNEQNLKVRQPLQTLFIACDDAAKSALALFEPQLLNELNVKELRILDNADALQVQLPTVNFKLAGAALKSEVNAFKQHLSALSSEDAQAVAAQVLAGGAITVPGWPSELPAELFTLQSVTKPGIVSTLCGEITVALDVELTDELRQEGAVRDVVRQIQIMRKEAGYAVEQHIHLHLITQSPIMQEVIRRAREHIAAEVLADDVDLETADIEHLREQLMQKMQAAEPFGVRCELEVLGTNIMLEVIKSHQGE